MGTVGDESTEQGGAVEGRGTVGDESTEQGGAVKGRGIGDSAYTPQPRRVREASRRRLSYSERDDDIGWQTDSDAGS